jgi:rhamnose transport system ATP-binding protein
MIGFAGLEGSGVETLFRTLFGLQRASGGRIRFNGETVTVRTPGSALAAGWGLVPASRREEGLMLEASLGRNTTLLILDRLRGWLGLMDRGKERVATADWISQLGIVARGGEQPVGELSGGNQQKALLAKWLATGPRVLLLNDPTRGVDVGAKAEIHRLCRALADRGMTLILTSSEVEEVLGVCDRVLVLAEGRLAGSFDCSEVNRETVLQLMTGAAESSSF